MSIELQELLSAPLFGPEGEEWKKQPRQMPEEYEKWVDAQLYSEKASNLFASFKDTILPLEKTRKQNVLDDMWKQINSVRTSGPSIAVLTDLEYCRIMLRFQEKESMRYGSWRVYSTTRLSGLLLGCLI